MPKEPPRNRPGNKLWSYIAGRRGINRVRVFERYKDGPLWVEWFDADGRHRETLTGTDGAKILSKEVGVEMAEYLAERQRAAREAATLRELRGLPERHTLGALLTAMHADRGQEWSESYQRDQARFRAFWTERLGEGSTLDAINPAMVERLARKEAERNKWSARTRQSYLRYIVDAFYYAQNKLKWITERENLSAVAFPRPDSRKRRYSTEEVRKLLEHAAGVDLRIAAALWIAATTGRRLNAIRNLRTEDVRTEAGRMLLTFRGATDKAGQTAESALPPSAADAVSALLPRPAVEGSGLLFPSGDLEDGRKRRRLVRKEDMIGWLHAVEEAAKVPVVKGRGLHGIKRWYATVASDTDAAARQAGTSRQTFEGVYRQDRLEAKAGVADQMEELLAG